MGKRIFDILFSISALVFFLPIGIVITCLILIRSPGPIFYSCQRMGKYGRPIRCWKFRTMCRNAEQQLHSVLATSVSMQKEWQECYKLKYDPRVTSIGKFLRKTSLDELPQFLNVIAGDLSVVGPRPVTEIEVQKYYKDKAKKILSVKPGLTGLWQTSERNVLSFDERVCLEETYIDRRSLSLDLKIIIKTIFVMFFSRNGY